MKFCTVIRGPKSKIEFVCDKNLITPSPILPQFFLKFANAEMQLLGYNSVAMGQIPRCTEHISSLIMLPTATANQTFELKKQ